MNPYYDTAKDIRGRLVTIVPVWYPEDLAGTSAAELLAETLGDIERVSRPEHVCLVVDGQPRWAPVAEAEAEQVAENGGKPHVLVLPENEGKGAAVRAGMERMLDATDCPYFVVRDADGDHFTNDVPSLFRLARQIEGDADAGGVLVVGARADRRRPMGLVRGELERWVVSFIWDALRYGLAARGRAVNETFLGPYDPTPDLLSGFKLYTREAARLSAEGMTRAMADHPELRVGRYAGEVVPVVETLLAGGVVGQMVRGTLEGQPVSGFASLKRLDVYPSRILWTAKRLELPPEVALQLFDNAVARTPLSSEAVFDAEFTEMRRFLTRQLDAPEGRPTRSGYC